MTNALVIVDVQGDFLPGGSLAVTEGDQIIEPLKQLAKTVDLVVATRDWHPSDHCSFSDDPKFVDGSWPSHCVADTPGGQLHPEIEAISEIVVNKGFLQDTEAYSGFEQPIQVAKDAFGDWQGQQVMLADVLKDHNVQTVHVAGLATDYCVISTAVDALRQGFEVIVHKDASRAIDPENAERLLEDFVRNDDAFAV